MVVTVECRFALDYLDTLLSGEKDKYMVFKNFERLFLELEETIKIKKSCKASH